MGNVSALHMHYTLIPSFVNQVIIFSLNADKLHLNFQ